MCYWAESGERGHHHAERMISTSERLARLRLDRLAPPYTRVYGRFIVNRIFIRPLWTDFKSTTLKVFPRKFIIIRSTALSD